MASLLKRRCNRRTPLPVQSGEHVGDETTDGLRLLIVIGARGAFVAVLRNHAQIVLTHPNRETPWFAALRFPPRSQSLAQCCQCSSVRREDDALKPFLRRERPKGPQWPVGHGGSAGFRLWLFGLPPVTSAADRSGRFRAARSIG